MGFLFSSPKPPKIQAAPKTGDKAVQEAAAEAARKRRRAGGFRSTILSSLINQGGGQTGQTFGS